MSMLRLFGLKNAKHEQISNESIDFPIKLVEPSTGKSIELEIDSSSPSSELCKEQLLAYANGCKGSLGANYELINDYKVRITFPDLELAEASRKTWR